MGHFYGSCDLFRDRLIIPTIVRCQAITRAQCPVIEADARNIDDIYRALKRAFSNGNPEIAEKDLGVKTANYWVGSSGIKGWPTYSREITNWDFGERNGSYQLYRYKRIRGGGLVPDAEFKLTLPEGTSLEIACDHFAKIINARAEEVATQRN